MRAPPRRKWKGHKGKKPGLSERMKARWADPAFRAMMIERHAGGGPRTDVPNGMRRPQAEAAYKKAEESAKDTMKKLEKAGVITSAEDAGNEALETALKVMRQPGDKKNKLAAAKLVLEYTKAKPASKQDITVNAAEAWLEQVAAKDDDSGNGDKGETPSDA